MGLGYALECSVGSGGPLQGSLPGARHKRTCARVSARLSLPPRSGVCQFSSLNFVDPLGHIYCRTIGKDRKAAKREKALALTPCHKVNSGAFVVALPVHPLWGCFSQQQSVAQVRAGRGRWLSTACSTQSSSGPGPSLTCSMALAQMVCPSGPVYLVGK